MTVACRGGGLPTWRYCAAKTGLSLARVLAVEWPRTHRATRCTTT